MKKTYVITCCLSGLILVYTPSIAEMYQWVDKNGVTHFTDNPSKGSVNSESAPTPLQPATPEKLNHNPTLKTLFPMLTIREMLRRKEFKKLDATLSDYQRAYEKNVRNEDDLFDAYRAFYVKGTYYEALLNEWIKSQPNNYQPYLARASYFYNLGWESRGHKWAGETSNEQMEGMKRYFSKASKDIEQVLKIKADHVVSYYFLINIYKAVGGHDEVTAIVSKALEKCPTSFIIRSAYLLAITPRWGGTYEEMDQFATEAQRYASDNPRLKILKGYVFYDAGSMQRSSKNFGVAVELLSKALAFGDLARFYEERASIYEHLDKHDEALQDINTAIDMSPQDPDLYYRKSRILSSKKMMQEALKSIEIADQLKPEDESIAKQKKWIADTLVYSGYSHQKTKNLTEAIKDYNSAIKANPNNAYSYYRRARLLIDQKEMTSAFNDLAKAIELDPNDLDFYLLMDWLLTKKSDWNGIIHYWDKFITLHPDNDRAYLERGGAYFHKGDIAAAVADAKRAADLGNAEGQKLYDRYKGQVK